jgi:hypothetical protein
VDFAAILDAPQPAFQPGDRGFECGIEGVCARLATDNRPTAASSDLDMLAGLALAAVAFVVELDVEQVDGSVESLQAGEFLRDVDAEVVGISTLRPLTTTSACSVGSSDSSAAAGSSATS